MDDKYLENLVFLDVGKHDALYEQRENAYKRLPFEMEKTLYTYIYNGQPEEAKRFYRSLALRTPSVKVPVGRTSRDRIRQMKYSAVSAIAIACRAAIEGGAAEAIAYSMSDDAILAIDEKSSIPDILIREIRALIEFAELVQSSRERKLFSPAVRSCIDYLTVHSHANVTLEELSACSEFSKEYLAKLFKKEVGMSFIDYHLKLRVDEAKTLLQKGLPCGEVASTLGFSTQSYFVKQFRKLTGITPKKYAVSAERSL